jgi:hypothetical protein
MFEQETGAQGDGEGQLLEISTTAARSLQNKLVSLPALARLMSE